MTWRAHTRRLVERVTLMVGRGAVRQSDDTKNVQILQIELSPLEVADLPRASEYGFASLPPDNCRVIVVFNGGDRSKGVIIGTHDIASRFKLANKGEVALFDNAGENGAPGKWIWAKGAGGGWEIECNHEPFVLKDASAVTISAKAGQAMPVTINQPDGGGITLNMGGGNVQINDPGGVVLGPAGKNVVMDGDPVSGGGHVIATQNIVKV